jgi:hypothetical protein
MMIPKRCESVSDQIQAGVRLQHSLGNVPAKAVLRRSSGENTSGGASRIACALLSLTSSAMIGKFTAMARFSNTNCCSSRISAGEWEIAHTSMDT